MISTTITKQFFDMKLKDMVDSGYFIEYKECTPYWVKRLEKYNTGHDDQDIPIVFLVGSTPYRFKAVSIWHVCHDFIPSKYAEAIITKFAYAIRCVENK